MGIHRCGPQSRVDTNEQKTDLLGKNIINRVPVKRRQLLLRRSATFYELVPLRHSFQIAAMSVGESFRFSMSRKPSLEV